MGVPSYVGMFEGKDWLTVQDWTQEELKALVDAALDLKKKKYSGEPHEYLKGQTLFMIFYNRSLRTRNSFEAGMFHQMLVQEIDFLSHDARWYGYPCPLSFAHLLSTIDWESRQFLIERAVTIAKEEGFDEDKIIPFRRRIGI